ncbi:MAG: hypothetical protein K5681_03200 [Treponema sp.]|nr:hypothetical protein [Treponema sp.]
MNSLVTEFSLILKNEDKVLTELSEKQKEMRKVLMEKNWDGLLKVMSQVNNLSESFQEFDSRRDEIQEQLKTEELKPFLESISALRSKLLKCKVENQVISNYVTVTRQFIAEVVEKALPQTRNKNYTKTGALTQPQTSSVLVDVRG